MAFEKKKKRKKNTYSGAMVEPYSDEEWIARQDAEALARASAAQSDPDRMARAKAWAAKQLEASKANKAQAEKLIELGTS